jgi:predicted TIM-barrel fold metal-dependent hydrolase
MTGHESEPMRAATTRRRALQGLGGMTLGAAGALGLERTATAAQSDATPTMTEGRTLESWKADDHKIIDFRNRPPLLPFSGLYNVKMNNLQVKRLNSINRGANATSPAMSLVDKPEGMDQWWKEIDEAGIDGVVVNGRYAAGLPNLSMDNDTLEGLQEDFPGKLFGLAQVNLDQDPDLTAAAVEKAIKEQGLYGANLEPGYQSKGFGEIGTNFDDPSFWPILEVLAETGAFLLLQTGQFAGADISFNNPPALDRLLSSFPKVNVVLAHGLYPYIQEALGLANKHPQLHISPDVYMFWPGGQLYQMNIELLPDQFIFGSAFPFAAMTPIVEDSLALPISDEVMEKYMYGNAARLLRL